MEGAILLAILILIAVIVWVLYVTIKLSTISSQLNQLSFTIVRILEDFTADKERQHRMPEQDVTQETRSEEAAQAGEAQTFDPGHDAPVCEPESDAGPALAFQNTGLWGASVPQPGSLSQAIPMLNKSVTSISQPTEELTARPEEVTVASTAETPPSESTQPVAGEMAATPDRKSVV